MVDSYHRAEEQLVEIAHASKGTIQLHDKHLSDDGFGRFHISIRFEGIPRVTNGLHVRAREKFVVWVPDSFPYHYPVVSTSHQRFAGFAHVQWRRQLCLYRSSNEWRPEDGMYGFIHRLDAWVRDAALDHLDPDDAPLHPPVAYPTVDHLIVPRANAPPVEDSPWFGFAEIHQQHNRTEIVRWCPSSKPAPKESALAVLLHKPLPFEYPDTISKLLDELKNHGIEYSQFLINLAQYARHTSTDFPLLIVVGTPMRRVVARGPLLQHLAVWQVSASDANNLRDLGEALTSERNVSERSDVIRTVVEWSVTANVEWCQVEDMRPEITLRRDQSSPMSWFLDKRVAIWGCGAVGSKVAESVVRAGARQIELCDNKRVTPGILVRQGFEDADIGKFKTDALKARLKRIAPQIEIGVSYNDLVEHLLEESEPFQDIDLVIDCTASDVLRTVLEQKLDGIHSRPVIASIAIDANATMAVGTVATVKHSGATLDLVRRLKIEACRKDKLGQFAEAFWPNDSSLTTFQPEPGCSEPTFEGSDVDIAALYSRILNAIAEALTTNDESHSGFGWFCHSNGPIHSFSWHPDHTLTDLKSGYSVRVSTNSLREMQAWAQRSSRVVGPGIETGGLVFGELNDVAGVLWVSEVDGPPPDSVGTADSFTCGVEGTAEAASGRHDRFRGSAECVGSWHTHPSSAPELSDVDITAAAQLLTDPTSGRRTALLLILSCQTDTKQIGAYIFRNQVIDQTSFRLNQVAGAKSHLPPPARLKRNIGLALSGGGSRAIAFHLGCLRALHDLRLLDCVEVISSVSGGSVIAAMYAYSCEPFHAFDERVVELLRRGLQRDIVRETLRPVNLIKVFIDRLNTFWHVLLRFTFKTLYRLRCLKRSPALLSEPRARRFTRTEAFRSVLKRALFGDARLHELARTSLATVINATELRTGSAFRFGSRESSCWRYGSIPPNDAFVADAVVASAAYPLYLPSLDREYEFTDRDGTNRRVRVLLSDGGIYENLGIGPVDSDRNSSFSDNVFNPDYIVCCDAGTGIFDDDSFPAKMLSRLHRSFLTTFRKVQDATRQRLHSLVELGSGSVSGFVLPYLGQQDRALPWFPAGLPNRDSVRDYPTDFASMADSDIERLALRGEMLTRFLVSYYLPDL